MSLIDSPHKSGKATTISSHFPIESKICLQEVTPIKDRPLTTIGLLSHARLSDMRIPVAEATASPINEVPKVIKRLPLETLKETANHLLSMLGAFQEQADQFKQEIPIRKSSPSALETQAERLTLAYQHPLYKEIRSATWQEKYVMDSEPEPILESKSPPPSPIPLGKGFTGECLENLKTRIQNIITEASLLRNDHNKTMPDTSSQSSERDFNTSVSEWNECSLLLNHIIEQGNITLSSLEAIPELNMLIFYLQEFFHTIRSLRKTVDDRDKHIEKFPKAEAIFTNISKMYAEDIKRVYLKVDTVFKTLRPQLMNLTPATLLQLANNSSDIGNLSEPVARLRTKLISLLDNEQARLSHRWHQASHLYEQCLEELDMIGLTLKRFSKFDYPAFSVAYTIIRRDYWLEPTSSKQHLLHRLTNSLKPPYAI